MQIYIYLLVIFHGTRSFLNSLCVCIFCDIDYVASIILTIILYMSRERYREMLQRSATRMWADRIQDFACLPSLCPPLCQMSTGWRWQWRWCCWEKEIVYMVVVVGTYTYIWCVLSFASKFSSIFKYLKHPTILFYKYLVTVLYLFHIRGKYYCDC